MVQSELCDGCGDCEGACTRLYGDSRISIREIDGSNYPIVCQHCKDAHCVIICPTDAMENNSVVAEKCIGCGLCLLVCPFGAVNVDGKKANKCDLCSTRDLENNQTSCIKACSKRALSLISPDIIKKQKQEDYLKRIANLNKPPKSKEDNFVNMIASVRRTNKAHSKK